MTTRAILLGLALASVTSRDLGAQTTARPSTAVGVWRGTSLCLVRPSACKDEIVVYRITPLTAPDSVSIDARKIVNGQEEEMGILTCIVSANGSRLTCTMPQGVWRFAIRGDSLVGDLRHRDNTRFRDVRTTRAR